MLVQSDEDRKWASDVAIHLYKIDRWVRSSLTVHDGSARSGRSWSQPDQKLSKVDHRRREEWGERMRLCLGYEMQLWKWDIEAVFEVTLYIWLKRFKCSSWGSLFLYLGKCADIEDS